MDINMHGPVLFELKVLVKNPETGQEGKATIEMPAFQYPFPDNIKERVRKFEEEELPQIDPNLRLMTKQEAWDSLCEEKFGSSNFAIPGGHEWDEVPYTPVQMKYPETGETE